MSKNCVSTSSPEFQSLVGKTNSNPVILAGKVSLWQDKYGIDKFPTINQLIDFDINHNNSYSSANNQLTYFTSEQRIDAGRYLTQAITKMLLRKVKVGKEFKNYENVTYNELLNTVNAKGQHTLDLRFRLLYYISNDTRKLIKRANESKEDIYEMLKFRQLMMLEIKNNKNTLSLYNDVRTNLKNYFNRTVTDVDDITSLKEKDEYQLSKLSVSAIFTEAEEKNFRSETKSLIASGVEYTYDKEGNPVKKINPNTGMYEPVDYELIFPKLQSLLSDVNSEEELRNRMLAAEKIFPTLIEYNNALFNDNSAKTVQDSDVIAGRLAGWFTDFNKTLSIDEVGVSVQYDEHKLVKYNKSYKDLIISAISDKLSSYDSFGYYQDNKIRAGINELTSKIKRSTATLNKVTVQDMMPTIEALATKARIIGIEDLKVDTIIGYINDNYFNDASLDITHKIDTLNDLLDKVTPSNGAGFDFNNLKTIARIIDTYTMTKLRFSYRGMDGNQRNSVTKHNSITRWLSRAKSNDKTVQEEFISEIEELLEIPGFEHSNLLSTDSNFSIVRQTKNGLKTNKSSLEHFKLIVYAGQEYYNSNRIDSYLNQSDINWVYTKMAMYLNRLNQTESIHDIKTVLPIFGDSSNHYLINRYRTQDSTLNSRDLSIDENNNVTIDSTSKIYKPLLRTVKQEIARINAALVLIYDTNGELRSEEELNKMELIENYHFIVEGGKKVYFKDGKLTGNVFNFTNIDTINSADFIVNNTLDSEAVLAYATDTAINEYISKMYKQNKHLYDSIKDDLKVNSVRTDSEVKTSSLYSEHYGDNAYESLVIEQMINSYINNVEIQLLFGGVNAMQGSTVKVTQRLKKVVQQGEQGISSATFTNYVVKDKMVHNDSLVNAYNKLLLPHLLKIYPESTAKKMLKTIVEPYSKAVTSSDGWSICTTKHWINIMKSFGKWNEVSDLFEFKNNKYSLKEGLNVNDFNRFIQVLKPIHVENKVHEITTPEGFTQKMIVPIYQKLSEFLPSDLFINSGSEFDEIISFMEKNDVDQLTFKSGRKDGIINVYDIFDEENNLDIQIDPTIDKPEVLSMKNYFIQLDIPDHIKDEKIKMAVQFYKHVISNIISDDNYKFNGNTVTGATLKKQHFDLFSKIIEKDAEKLYDRIGLYEDSDGINFDSHNKIYDIISKEAFQRDYSTEEIESVTISADGLLGNDFSFSTSKVKFTALLNSLFSNSITNTKISGGNLVILSDAFSNKKTKDDVQTDEDLGYSIDDEGNVVVECYIPPFSSDFINDDGTVKDLKDIDDRLLHIIGYRVPISSKHSTFTFKVKGFTDPVNGSIIVPPNFLVTRTGWDFDIDKCYIMTKAHKKVKGKIVYDSYTGITYENYIKDRINELSSSNSYISELLAKRQGVFNDISQVASNITNKYSKIKDLKNPEIRVFTQVITKIESLTRKLESNKLDNESQAGIQNDINYLKSSIVHNTEVFENIDSYLSEFEVTEAITEDKKILTSLKAEVKNITKDIRSILDDYYYLIEEKDFEKAKAEDSNSILSRNQLQNKLLDVWTVLLEQGYGVVDGVKTASYDENIAAREEINEILGIDTNNPLNPTNPEEQIQIRNSVIGGKEMLNIAANISSINTILENTQATINRSTFVEYEYSHEEYNNLVDLYGEDNVTKSDKIIVVRHNLLGWTKDDTNFNADNIKISYNLAEDVDHTVDASKDPMIKNITPFDFKLNSFFKVLGLKNKQIAYLFNQYAVDVMLKVNSTTNKINNPFASTVINGTRVEMLTELMLLNGTLTHYDLTDKGKLKSKSVEKVLNVIDYVPSDNPILPTEKRLRKMLHTKQDMVTMTNEERIEFIKEQLNILDFYAYEEEVNNDFTSEISNLNADKIYAGTSFEAHASLINAVESTSDSKLFVGDTPLLQAVYKGESYPPLKAYYKHGVVNAYNSLKQLYSTQNMVQYDKDGNPIRLIDMFKEEFGNFNSTLATDINSFETYLTFLTLKDFHLFNLPMETMYERLGINKVMSDGIERNSFIDKIEYYKKLPESKRPKFIDYIEYKVFGASPNITRLRLKGVSANNIYELHNSFNEMFDSPSDREFIEDLIRYMYVFEGMQGAGLNVSRLLTNYVSQELGLTSPNGINSSYINDVKNQIIHVGVNYNYNNIIREFVKNNAINNKYVALIKSKDTNYGVQWNSIFDSPSNLDGFILDKNVYDKEPNYIVNSRFVKTVRRYKKDDKEIKVVRIYEKVSESDTKVIFKALNLNNNYPYIIKPIDDSSLYYNDNLQDNNNSTNDKNKCKYGNLS